MSDLLAFTGGMRCEDCDEQINPRRLRISPNAKLCTSCEQDWELRQRTMLNSARATAVVIIRR